MGYNRFDELAKALADSSISRRETLRRLGGGLVGAALAGVGIGCEREGATSPETADASRVGVLPGLRFGGGANTICRNDGYQCKVHTDCCKGYCDPSTNTCGCKSGTTNCS